MATETVQAPPQHKEVENFSDSERSEWLKTGKMPLLEEEKVQPSGEKSPKDASAASKPASEDGGEKSGSGPGKKARDDEKNWRALEAERDALKAKQEAAERELEEYRTGKRKPEEKKADAASKLLELPVRPKMKDFMSDGALDSDKYEAALDKYEADKSAYVAQQTNIRTAAAQQEQSITTWTNQLKEKYGEKAKDLEVKKTVDALAKTLNDAPAFFMFLNDSKNFVDLLYVLGGKEFKLDELLAEARDPKTMTSAIRKLRDIERDVEIELAKQPKASDKDEKKDNLTKAGKPPSEAAGASSSPADDGSSDYVMKHQKQFGKDWGEVYRERRNKEEREKRRKKVN